MIIRCIKCNNWASFSNKKGAKLSDISCGCGGTFERLTATQVEGPHPVHTSRSLVHTIGDRVGKKYFLCYKNSQGDLFDFEKTNPKVIPL